ncbi:hypothetical protein F4802DRAFT_356873 [Xylaria palmicola]|nr:hypothetical protein F4802DRAFT_356873 [Xylaria palmicola]
MSGRLSGWGWAQIKDGQRDRQTHDGIPTSWTSWAGDRPVRPEGGYTVTGHIRRSLLPPLLLPGIHPPTYGPCRCSLRSPPPPCIVQPLVSLVILAIDSQWKPRLCSSAVVMLAGRRVVYPCGGVSLWCILVRGGILLTIAALDTVQGNESEAIPCAARWRPGF